MRMYQEPREAVSAPDATIDQIMIMEAYFENGWIEYEICMKAEHVNFYAHASKEFKERLGY
jgi:hypothetical protein